MSEVVDRVWAKLSLLGQQISHKSEKAKLFRIRSITCVSTSCGNRHTTGSEVAFGGGRVRRCLVKEDCRRPKEHWGR